MVKQKIIAILILVNLLGCSAKNPASKNGAILGTTAGAMAGAVMGLAISASKSEMKDFTQNALIGAVLVGAIGYMTGSAMGYVVDKVGNQETRKIEEMEKSHKIVRKSFKHKLVTPESINDAQISNEIPNENSTIDVNKEAISNEVLEEDRIPDMQTGQIVRQNTSYPSVVTQAKNVEEVSTGSVFPIEQTVIQSDNEEVIVDTQENKALW